MKVIGYTATFLILLVLSMLFSGYALSILWGWFFVPLLGAPDIGIAGALGIALIVTYLTHQYQKSDSDSEFSEVLIKGAAIAIVKPCMALLIGWIITFWI